MIGCAAVAAVGSLWACLRPTQITLRLTTDVPCDQIAERGVSIWNGTGLRDAVPLTSTRDCTGGAPIATVGTLVIAPSGSRSDEITVTAAAGVGRKSEECAAAGFEGCIVARRRLRYVEHTPLELPVLLSLSCLDKLCDDDKTCVPCKDAACAEPRCAPIDEPAACDTPGNTCAPARSASGVGVGDAALPEAGLQDAATDAPLPPEAGVDGGLPTARQLVVGTGTAFYGLAELEGTLYWTEDPPTIDPALRFSSLSALLANGSGVAHRDAGIAHALPAPPYRGLDAVRESAISTRIGVGLTVGIEPETCGVHFAAVADGGAPAAIKLTCGPGVFGKAATGVAFFPGTSSSGVLTVTQSLKSANRFEGDGGANVLDAAPPTGYARRIGDAGVYYASGNSVQLVTASASPTPHFTGPPDSVIVAVAESPAGVRYVTVVAGTGSNVFRRVPGGFWTPLASLPNVEDILVVPVGGSSGGGRLVHVLVAARDAIWIFENVADP